MQEGQSLADVATTVSDIYGGSDQKAAKIFAMGFYQGLARYDGSNDDHRVGQLQSVAQTLEEHIESLLEASSDERALSTVSKEIRNDIGPLGDEPEALYNGQDALLPYLHTVVTRNGLVGTNFRDVGLGMIEKLEKLTTVKGDSSNGKYLREFNEIHRYLDELAGDVQ